MGENKGIIIDAYLSRDADDYVDRINRPSLDQRGIEECDKTCIYGWHCFFLRDANG